MFLRNWRRGENNGPYITFGSGGEELAREISKEVGIPLIETKSEKFPNGELFIQIDKDVLGRRIYIVQSTYYPQTERWFELFMIIDLLFELGVKEIIPIIPYFGYSKQDKRRIKYEATGAFTILKILRFLGIERLVTIDLHFCRGLKETKVEGITITNLSSIEEISKRLKKFSDFCLVVDDGTDILREELMKRIGIKKTIVINNERAVNKINFVSTGRKYIPPGKFLIFDDMAVSGATINSMLPLFPEKSKKVLVVVHAAFMSESVVENLFRNGISEIISTNTIPSRFSAIDTTKIISNFILKVEGKLNSNNLKLKYM